ncbi:unnamed protein product [Rotaria socialis]|nr:unnamed protein product [Rotaria socialis]
MKMQKVHKKNFNVSTQKSLIATSQSTSVRLTLSQLSLSNAEVFPLENIQMNQFYDSSSTQLTKETSPSIAPQ